MTHSDTVKTDHFLTAEADTLRFGATLAGILVAPMLVFLHGDLGAGKTTMTRGVLRGLGHTGSVKSPTYTLVEPYEPGGTPLYHFDLYRLGAPEELDYLGLRDYLEQEALLLVEWPERGAGVLPAPDIEISLAPEGEGRRVELKSGSARGASALLPLRF